VCYDAAGNMTNNGIIREDSDLRNRTQECFLDLLVTPTRVADTIRDGEAALGKSYEFSRSRNRSLQTMRGFTLVELIVATTVLIVLTTLAIPLARVTIKREKERELRRDLWEMRDAIDRYKDLADRGGLQTKVGSENYPPDLDTLVKGVDVQGQKLRFLRRIPIDPMTGTTEWGLHSMQDDPNSDSWGEQNVFDVYTKSEGTALDGTKYKEW